MNYTPGPWKVEREDYEPEAGDEWRMKIVSLNDEYYLSLVEGAYFVVNRGNENQANADLIAAAPELYESLREMYDWRYVRRQATSQNDLDSQRDAMFERACHALARANGKPSPLDRYPLSGEAAMTKATLQERVDDFLVDHTAGRAHDLIADLTDERWWPVPKSGCAMCRLDILEGHGHQNSVTNEVTRGSRLEWV